VRERLALIIVLGGLMTAVVLHAQDSPGSRVGATRTVWDGLYTAAQSARGQIAYDRACAECHMADLSGHEYAGPLAGFGFLLKWSLVCVRARSAKTRALHSRNRRYTARRPDLYSCGSAV
jgi:mono/diheme cytochrome c family protein